jgi:methionine sulfoxide reductase heme-binding subunit
VSLIVAMIATVCLMALGATSFDAAIRRMGARGWDRLHGIVYAVTALALIHYLLSPDTYPEQFLASGIFVWLMGWRWLDRRGRGTDVLALVALTVASALFAALLEVGWLWAYHGYEPIGTFRGDFTLDLGVPPAWQVLGLGLVAAIAVFLRNGFRREAGDGPRAAA